jgi:hypothetical protein
VDVAQLVLMIGGVLIAGGLGIYGWYRNQKRIEALHAFCLSKGWGFAPSDDSLAFRWTGDPFDEGTDRHARAVVTGNLGSGSFVAFDYSYVTQTTDGKGNTSRTTHRYAVCALAIPTYLPEVSITPENVMTRMGRAFGVDDIELESDDFNRRYRVTARNAKFASDVLSPRTMEMLLARPALHFRIAGTDVLCWEPGGTTPADLLARTSTLAAFVAGIPSFVWRDHGVEPTGGVAQ